MSDTVAIMPLQMPDGRVASFEQMQVYGAVLQQFVREQEVQLSQCKDARHHNQVVDYLEQLAAAYNGQLHLFKSTQKERYREMLAFLICLGGSSRMG